MSKNWYEVNKEIEYYANVLKASDPELFTAFVELNQFNRTAVPHDAEKLLRVFETGKIIVGYYGMVSDRPPYQDHARLFKSTKTGAACMAFHPYNDPERMRPELEAWAGERRLKAVVYDLEYSWYYPGHTALVILSLPETIIKIPGGRGGHA